VKIRSAKLASWNVFYCKCITAILHHWKNVFARWCTWPWTLKHCDHEGNVIVSAFILPNANAPLTFRIFSWTFVLNSCSCIISSFSVSEKSLNLSSTNLPWEQQESYILLLTYTHLQNVNFYTHYIPYFYLPINASLRFRYWQLKVSFLIVYCVTFLIVSFFNITFPFSGVFVNKLAIGEDKLETFEIFLWSGRKVSEIVNRKIWWKETAIIAQNFRNVIAYKYSTTKRHSFVWQLLDQFWLLALNERLLRFCIFLDMDHKRTSKYS